MINPDEPQKISDKVIDLADDKTYLKEIRAGKFYSGKRMPDDNNIGASLEKINKNPIYSNSEVELLDPENVDITELTFLEDKTYQNSDPNIPDYLKEIRAGRKFYFEPLRKNDFDSCRFPPICLLTKKGFSGIKEGNEIICNFREEYCNFREENGLVCRLTPEDLKRPICMIGGNLPAWGIKLHDLGNKQRLCKLMSEDYQDNHCYFCTKEGYNFYCKTD